MTSRRRLPTLDGLRGVAVMGILLMNVVGFALPSGAYFNPLATGPASHADLAAWALAFVAVDGKMRALFSILFGASTLLVVTRAADDGRDPARVHMARMATLALFGAAHWVLLWPGDILLHYAIVGTAALPLTQAGSRTRLRVAALLLVAQALIQAALVLGALRLHHAVALPHPAPALLAQWRALAAGVGVGSPDLVAAEVARLRGPWSGLVAHNLPDMLGGTPFLLLFDGPETLAFMLLGMTALQSGFLAGTWPRRRAARLAVIALAIGWPAEALLAWGAARSGFDTVATFAASTLGGVPLRPLLALGYAATLMPLVSGGGGLAARVRAAGACAFSNYLGTSLLLCAVFDGWGLGLFARVPRAACYLVVLPAWALMLGWSLPWLRRYRHGPLEWAWRSLARGRPVPLRR